MRVLVLSDTHAPRRWKGMPPALEGALHDADLVLHGGDVCTAEVLDTLSGHAPVHVVLGYNDGPDVRAWGARDALVLDLDGLTVAMIHDAGPSRGRARRMRQRFPAAGLVVYGHSHIPLDDAAGEVHLFNPGSPTDRRRQPHGTYGVLEIAAGRLARSQIVALPRQSA